MRVDQEPETNSLFGNRDWSIPYQFYGQFPPGLFFGISVIAPTIPVPNGYGIGYNIYQHSTKLYFLGAGHRPTILWASNRTVEAI